MVCCQKPCHEEQRQKDIANLFSVHNVACVLWGLIDKKYKESIYVYIVGYVSTMVVDGRSRGDEAEL